MKQGTLITKIIMFILLAAVVFYLAISAVQSFTDPFSAALTYQDVLNDSAEITGIVVREEQVLSGGSGILDLLPDEGERVAAGETVAVLYQSQEALDRKQQLQSMELELEQLEYALRSGGNLSDAAKLERQIASSLLTLRTNMAAGNLSSLESDTLTLRSQMLQRDFAYSSSGNNAETLAQYVVDLEEQTNALRAQISSTTSSIRAPRSGLFSGRSDGLEQIITPGMLETLSAEQLLNLPAGTASSDSVGKLITGDHWFFAAVVDSKVAARLKEGASITVAFSRDYTGEVDMTVERIGREEADGCVLILSANRNLKNVTLLREQSVELIFHQYTGIRIPKQALRMETVNLPATDTQPETKTQVLGVYALVGARAQFKPVDIIREGSDHYLVSPAKDNDYFRTISAAEAKVRVLRAGDEVIVSASNLYDGKVVLE